MGLITNLQQTVADHIIRVNDHDSDASTITSNEQRKRRIPHLQSKSSIRRLHSSDAGTTGQINVPPDPGEIHRYIEFLTLENQDEESQMQQDETNDVTHQDTQASQDDTMSHDPDDTASKQSNQQDDNITMTDNAQSQETALLEVNGGINDDDLLAMMANDAEAMLPPNAPETSPLGPLGKGREQC